MCKSSFLMQSQLFFFLLRHRDVWPFAIFPEWPLLRPLQLDLFPPPIIPIPPKYIKKQKEDSHSIILFGHLLILPWIQKKKTSLKIWSQIGHIRDPKSKKETKLPLISPNPGFWNTLQLSVFRQEHLTWRTPRTETSNSLCTFAPLLWGEYLLSAYCVWGIVFKSDRHGLYPVKLLGWKREAVKQCL